MTDIEKLEAILEMRGRTLPTIQRVGEVVKSERCKMWHHLAIVNITSYGIGYILTVDKTHPTLKYHYIAVTADYEPIGIYKYIEDAQHFLVGDLKYAAVLGGKSQEAKPRPYDAVLGGKR